MYVPLKQPGGANTCAEHHVEIDRVGQLVAQRRFDLWHKQTGVIQWQSKSKFRVYAMD